MSGPGGEPAAAGKSSGGPLLTLLSAALRLWLRQQCEQLDRLELELLGSSGALLRGRLEGVRVRARGVRYQSLQLELVELSSGPLQIQMGSLWRQRSVQLHETFAVRGLVGFNAAGLNHSLAQPRWRGLGDQLAEELLGITPLSDLRLESGHLLLAARGMGDARPREVAAGIRPCPGGLELASLDGGRRSLLALDASLQLERAEIEAGLLVLSGGATVTP